MARILINGKWFDQVEPSTFSETDLEDRIILDAPSIYPEYYVIPFKQTVQSSYGDVKPDILFISKTYQEWYVVEVEMGYHSFESHVESQVERLADAFFGKREIDYLHQKSTILIIDQLTNLITNYPPGILIIVNEPKRDWIKPLSKYGARLAVFELFRSEQEEEIFRVNGEYPAHIVAIFTVHRSAQLVSC